MTTIINTPPTNTDGDSSGAGWAVAVIVLLAIIGVGAYVGFRYYKTMNNGGINVNVTLPNPPAQGGTPPAAQ